MDWNQSKLGYYADFGFVPALALAMLAFFYHGGFLALAAGAAAGFGAWTFLEYWIHRSLFHRVFKRGHDLHHRRPGGFVAAPFWLTALVHLGVAAAFTRGGDSALGVFLGLEAGYVAYIVMHDLLHHQKRKPKPGSWLERRWRLHAMHHHGLEKNFGVITSVWDHVFRTYWGPDWRPVYTRRRGVDGR